MALVMADLSEPQRETLMNLIYQRNIELTALTLQQLPRIPHHIVPCSKVKPGEPELVTEGRPQIIRIHFIWRIRSV